MIIDKDTVLFFILVLGHVVWVGCMTYGVVTAINWAQRILKAQETIAENSKKEDVKRRKKMNPYEILGLKQNCTDEQITKAFRRLSVKYHPDKGGDGEKFIELNAAVQILRDPFKRSMYDKTGVCSDMAEDMFTKIVIDKFKEMIAEWINMQIQRGHDIPIRDFCEQALANAKSGCAGKKSNLQDTIKNLKRRKGQVKCNGKDTIVLDMIQERIDDLQAQKDRIEHDLVLIAYVAAKVEEYESTEGNSDIDMFMGRFMGRTMHSSTTTFYQGA